MAWKPIIAYVLLGLTIVTIGGCRTPMPCSRKPAVAHELSNRIGAELGPNCGLENGSVPPGVDLSDGITEEEAVAVALWNNAALGELLAQLNVSRGQLYDAGLISDPQLVLLFPVGPKQFEFTAIQAVDALWLRPIRRRAAELDLRELSQQMVQNGLNMARDVRLAHANLVLAQDRSRLTAEAYELRNGIQLLAEKRLKAGDISDLEATSTEIETLTAKATAASAMHDVVLAQEQLRVLMGVAMPMEQVVAARESTTLSSLGDKQSVAAMAFAMRPDLRAIEIRKNAACRRLMLAKKQFMSIEAGYDANSDGEEGYEAGPGLRLTLPIFNANRGKIAIAEALVSQVDKQYFSLRDRVALEVRTAMSQLEQASEQLELFDKEILPTLQEAQELSQRNYVDGGVPYFLVLQTTGQFVDAQLRRADAAAVAARAIAELERSVGRRLPRDELVPSESEVPEESEQFARFLESFSEPVLVEID